MGAWQPILEGADAEAAADIIEEILSDLAGREPTSPDLAHGTSGWALVFAYHAASSSSESSEARAGDLLDWSIQALAERPLAESLHAGFSGVAWAVEHIVGGDEDANAAIDDALDTRLACDTWLGRHDLIFGLAGLAVYALERPATGTTTRCLERIAHHLVEAAESVGAGTRWRTSPEHLPEWQRDNAPDGYYDLGVSHGIPGVLGVLARIAARGVGGEEVFTVLRGGVEWLFSQDQGQGHRSRFPAWIAVGGGPEPARPAWCYGDLGVTAALFVTARAAGEPAWEATARRLALQAASVPVEEAGIEPAFLCHGAFGNAHLFNRMYQGSGEEALRDAALRWYRRGLALRGGEGIAGLADAPGLLQGAAGIGLALLAATTSVEPTWDRVLLADVPPLET